MKGILPLLFFCVTSHMSGGNTFSPSQERDQSLGSKSLQYRQRSDSTSPSNTVKNKKGMESETEGPMLILGQALLDTIVILLDESFDFRSTEGKRKSGLLDSGYRDSSVGSRSWSSSSETAYALLGFRSDSSSSSATIKSGTHDNGDENLQEECFIRQFLDIMNILVTNVLKEADTHKEKPPSGPKLLYLLANEMNKNLSSLDNIEVLDKALFKISKLIRLILRNLKTDLKSAKEESFEISLVSNFIEDLEYTLDGYIEAEREIAASGYTAPAIRLLLDLVDEGLEELSEGKTSSNNKASSLYNLRHLIAQLRNVLELLTVRNGSESPLLYDLLLSTKSILGQLIDQMSIFEDEPGSFNRLILNLMRDIHARLVQLLVGKKPKRIKRCTKNVPSN